MKSIIKRFLNWYFSKNTLPYWCLFLVDSIIVFMSGIFAQWALHGSLLFESPSVMLLTSLLLMSVSWIGALCFRTYLGVVRYSSFVDLMRVAYSTIMSLVVAICLFGVFELYEINFFTYLCGIGLVVCFSTATLCSWAVRIIVKTLYEDVLTDNGTMRVLIYGALSGGIGLAKNIRSQKPAKFKLCGFISHDKRAHYMQLMGQKVYHVDEDFATIIKEREIQALLVSPLQINDFRNNQHLQDVIINAGLKIYMAQQAKETSIDDEAMKSDEEDLQLKEVSVEDLLPRAEIKVNTDSVAKMLTGKRVLITGSAGSIGSELSRQIALFKPSSLILLDQAETPEHNLRLMMENDFSNVNVKTVVTSICREERMERIFREFRPDYVFHAAAYKHVPMMEDNPSDAVLNNILGTKIVADLSVKYGVQKFVMISTDKAVNPTSIMGCSKRICEIYVQSLNKVQSVTQFVTTRFGNVLGSNGSVIPLFREQIKRGGPITVTDDRITRFFMLIPEACQLVLEAATKGKGGEILVFDMGKPVRILDLAKRMIALSGAKQIEIKIIGLRDGEKLYEEVLNDQEKTKPSFHEKIRIADVREYDFDKISLLIQELFNLARHNDDMATVAKMKEIVPEFKSMNSIYEELDKKVLVEAPHL